jgi:regulator of RNase E activity RraA
VHAPSVNPDDKRIFDKLSTLCIDTVSGILMGMGYPDQYITNIPPITTDVKMIGRARTMRYLPIRPDLTEIAKENFPFSLTHRVVEDTQPGDILMVDAGGCTESGFIGDVIVSRFIVKGGAGIVMDGAIRDLTELRRMGLPIFTKGVHAAVCQRRLVGVDHNAIIKLSDVSVIPGDIILGDDEGTIVIPSSLAEQVAEKGIDTEHREAYLRKVIEEGQRPIHEVYPPNEEVLKAYEAYKRQELQ